MSSATSSVACHQEYAMIVVQQPPTDLRDFFQILLGRRQQLHLLGSFCLFPFLQHYPILSGPSYTGVISVHEGVLQHKTTYHPFILCCMTMASATVDHNPSNITALLQNHQELDIVAKFSCIGCSPYSAISAWQHVTVLEQASSSRVAHKRHSFVH